MNLSSVFKAVYYKMYPNGSLVQKLPEIGGILFGDMPEPIEKAFHPGAEGGFTYRSAVDFKLVSDFPETESEAVGVWNAFRVRKEKKISAYFGKGVAPVLFPTGLTLRSAEKVPVKNASSLPISWDRTEGFYWVLTYDLVLDVLRLKQNLASLAATHLLGYESPFSQEEITPVLNTFLKKAEKQSFKGVVKEASLKVYVSGNHVIGMDYHLPVMEYGKPSELLKIPDRIQYSGSQSVSEVEDVPDFYFRVQEGLVVPFYMDGVAACREGVREEEGIVSEQKALNTHRLETMILEMLSFYITSMKDSFEKVRNDTQTNNIEYGFNILSSYSYPLSAENFLDSIKDYSTIASDIYTSNGATHIAPTFDMYIEGKEDFIYGNPGNQLFLGFVHSHPDTDGVNICFSCEDLAALIKMSVILFWGNKFNDLKGIGKYFTLLIECPSCRYAFVISDPNAAKLAYQDTVANARKTKKFTLPAEASDAKYFTRILNFWYYEDENSPYYLPGYSIDGEKQSEKTIQYVLQKLGENSGILLFKSTQNNKGVFEKI